MAVELATGYVSLVPSARGFAAKVAAELGGELEDVGRKAGADTGGSFLGGFAGIAKAGAVGAAVAVGAALVKGVSDAIAAEAGNDRLAAQLGLTPEQAVTFGRTAGRLYGEAYGGSLSEVNDALADVQRNIGDALGPGDAALENATANALNLSSAFGVDLAGTTSAVGTILKNGLAPDAEAAFDILTTGFQNGTDKAGDLLDTFIEYSTQFRDLGIDGETALGILSQGLQAGARDADTVADALKEFAIRGIDGSDATAKGFATLGLDAEDMAVAIAAGGDTAAGALDLTLDRLREIEDPVARNAAAVELFGTKAEDLGEALFALDPSEAAAGLGEVAGSAAELDQTLNDNLATKFETLKRQAFQGLATIATTVLIPALEKLAEFGGKVADAFSEGGLGGVANLLREQLADLGPQILPAIRAVFGAIGDYVVEYGPTILRGLRDVWLTLGEFLYTEAYPAILKGAGLLLAALGTWIVSEAAPYLGRQFASWGKSAWQWVTEVALPAIQANVPLLAAAVGAAIVAAVPVIAAKALEWAVALTDWLVTTAVPFAVTKSAEFLMWFLGWITDTAAWIAAQTEALALALVDWFVTSAIPWGLEKANEFIAAILDWITGTALPYLVDKAPEWAAALVNWITEEAIPGALSKLGELFAAFAGWVGQTLSKVKKQGSDLAGDLIDGLGSGLESFFSQRVVPFFTGLAGRIGGLVATAGSWLYSAGQSIVNGLAVGAESFVGNLFAVFSGLPGRIRDAVGDLGGVLYNAGRSVISGLIEGIQDAIPGVRGVLGTVTNLIPDWKGPEDVDRKLLYGAGELLMEGLGEGIMSRLGDLRSQLGTVTDTVASAVGFSAPSIATASFDAPSFGRAGSPPPVNLYLDGRLVATSIDSYHRSRR